MTTYNNIAEEVFTTLSQCEHLMKTNVEVEHFEKKDGDEEHDHENPGFINGWHHFLDIMSNSVISFNKKEYLNDENIFKIEIRISDTIIIKIEDLKLIEEFLKKCEKKSQIFANLGILSSATKINKKLEL